jgi:hypothetical protein
VFTGLVRPMGPDDNSYSRCLITCTTHVYVQSSEHQWVSRCSGVGVVGIPCPVWETMLVVTVPIQPVAVVY